MVSMYYYWGKGEKKKNQILDSRVGCIMVGREK